MDSAGHPTLPRVPSNDEYAKDPEVGQLGARSQLAAGAPAPARVRALIRRPRRRRSGT
jgi:hypothetical protein